MTTVSNSSPLITLARVQCLHIFEALFTTIVIPVEVHEEIVVAGLGRPGAEEISRASWIEVVSAPRRDGSALLAACEGLGRGEIAAILLADSIHADLLVLDERRARRVAQAAGLSIVGCVGLLELAARKHLIRDLRSIYADLLRQGIRFDVRLLQTSLERLGLPPL